VLDDGQMTDSHGRKVNFKNCVILMTSNVGTRVVKDFGQGVGFTTKSKSDQSDDVKSILEKELKKKFAPEFINRLDEIIYFRDLDRENIKKILTIELEKSNQKLMNLGFSAQFEDSILEKLIEVGYDPQYGARPMKRAIQRWIDDPITEVLLESPKPNSKFKIEYDSEKDQTSVKVIEETKSKTRKKRDE
jgi:ATP-dependent Clp protease ATP-binding subunit ClpC